MHRVIPWVWGWWEKQGELLGINPGGKLPRHRIETTAAIDGGGGNSEADRFVGVGNKAIATGCISTSAKRA
jgi:hypothetical protein